MRSKAQAGGTRCRNPVVRRRQPATLPNAREHDDGSRPLIGDEQPPARRIQAERARLVAIGKDHLLERERARRVADAEYRETIVAAIRAVGEDATRFIGLLGVCGLLPTWESSLKTEGPAPL